MARISRYDFDITVSKEDKLIGTDSGGSTTKKVVNFLTHTKI